MEITTKLQHKGYERYVESVEVIGDISVQYVFAFPNGYGASVIKTPWSYGWANDLWELAVLFDGHLCYDTPITDDVLPDLTDEEVLEYLDKILEL